MFDLNEIDSLTKINPIFETPNFNIINREEYDSINNLVKMQYVDLNNLGKNILEKVEINYKLLIYDEMLEFVDRNYFSVIDLNLANTFSNKKIELGDYIYKFLCVDCLNVILPNYFNTIGCINLDQFELYLHHTINNDVNKFKNGFIKVINNTIEQCFKLSNIDKTVLDDKKFKDILRRYGLYIEFINYDDNLNFLNNYIIPVMNKYESDLLWRMS